MGLSVGMGLSAPVASKLTRGPGVWLGLATALLAPPSIPLDVRSLGTANRPDCLVFSCTVDVSVSLALLGLCRFSVLFLLRIWLQSWQCGTHFTFVDFHRIIN